MVKSQNKSDSPRPREKKTSEKKVADSSPVDAPVKTHKAAFEQLLDDAVLGVSVKKK